MSLLLSYVTMATALVCFLGYFWSIKKFFRSPEGIPSGMKLITGMGTLFIGLHLFAIYWFTSSALLQMIGIILYALAILIFWLAIKANWKAPLSLAYSKDLPAHIVTHGIYNWIRHPFYTSYTLAWIAGSVASSQIVLGLTVVIMFWLYYKSARLEELKFLNSKYAENYKNYQKQAGMFYPKFF